MWSCSSNGGKLSGRISDSGSGFVLTAKDHDSERSRLRGARRLGADRPEPAGAKRSRRERRCGWMPGSWLIITVRISLPRGLSIARPNPNAGPNRRSTKPPSPGIDAIEPWLAASEVAIHGDGAFQEVIDIDSSVSTVPSRAVNSRSQSRPPGDGVAQSLYRGLENALDGDAPTDGTGSRLSTGLTIEEKLAVTDDAARPLTPHRWERWSC